MENKIDVLDNGYVRLVDSMGDDLSVVNAARVSYDKESNELTEKDKRLIKFLADNEHFSVFRHQVLVYEVYAPLMVARQWYKYAVASSHLESQQGWNESCLPINETIKSWNGKQYTIEELLRRKRLGGRMPYVRSVDKSGEIVKGKINDIFKSGSQDVYEVESDLGFKVRTTSNHRYLTPNGYKELKKIETGDEIMMNGIPAYKDKKWLENKYVIEGLEQKEIAEIVGCSHHTIRKWVRIHGLQQDQIERVQKHNRKYGVFGKGLTNETSPVIAERSKKTSESKKGVKIKQRELKPTDKQNTSHWQARFLLKNINKCKYCDSSQSLEVHHIDKNPLNNNIENLEKLCTKHHHMRHGKSVLMVAHPIKVKNIKKVSHEDVYDIEIEKYHNFVSNQFILHNSRRYVTEEPTFYIPKFNEWREKPANSKQGSGDLLDMDAGIDLEEKLKDYIEEGQKLYEYAMDQGVAPEQARLFLPAYGLYVRWRWTASLQAVSHFINQRLAHDSQKEIREYAKAVYELTKDKFPISLEHLVKNN